MDVHRFSFGLLNLALSLAYLAVFSFSSSARNFKILNSAPYIRAAFRAKSKRRIIAKFILCLDCGNRIYAQNAKSHGVKFT